MLRPCVSHCATECVCTRIPLVWEREEGKGTGYGNWRVAGRGGWDGIRDACVSDVLMTLRNTEQANQYGRHCVHSGARHVPPRVIASGNVSAAFECWNESVHVQWDSSSRDTVDLSILYENLRGIPTHIYIYIYIYICVWDLWGFICEVSPRRNFKIESVKRKRFAGKCFVLNYQRMYNILTSE